VIGVQVGAQHEMNIGRIAACGGEVLQPWGLESMRPGTASCTLPPFVFSAIRVS
jgi:hypothetical protein